MNIAICDDLENDRNVLAHMISQYCRDYNLKAELNFYSNGRELLEDFSSGKFKLIFLDIYMKDEDCRTGIDFAKQIRLQDKDCIIVFITNSTDNALDAFEVDAMQYIVKPIGYDKIKHLFDRCQKTFSEDMRFIEVSSSGLSIKILLKNIYYIEVYDKVCLVHTNTQIIKTYTSLSRLWEMLGGKPFLRCHRSYIINMFYIDNIFENTFLLKNGDKVPISKDEASAIKQTYTDYFFEKIRSGEL